jgi:hypothetical protein
MIRTIAHLRLWLFRLQHRKTMAKTLTLHDEYGIICEAIKILPSDRLKIGFIEALAELEDAECHRK